MNMNMKEQLYILAIGKYGNIKQATEELHLTASALSIFLSTLERSLEIRLFDRIGKHFVPTQAGLLYMERAKEMLDIHSQYEKELMSLKGGSAGTLHLGIHPRRTLYLLPRAIMEFNQLYPQVRIITHEMTSTEMFDGLANGILDLIITNKDSRNANFSWFPFYTDRLVAITSADHPAVKTAVSVPGEALQWLDLTPFKEERFIVQKKFQSSRYYTDIALQYFDLQSVETFVIENLETACQLAAEGYGIAFNFETYVTNVSYCKPICYFLTGDYRQTIVYHMVTNKQKFQAHYIGDFMMALKKAMEFIRA